MFKEFAGFTYIFFCFKLMHMVKIKIWLHKCQEPNGLHFTK